MSDLISRSALIARLGINEDCMKCKHANSPLCKLCAAEACEAICDAPAVDAEPVKHGHWLIGVGENGEPIGTYCSECGWSWVNGVAAVNLNKALSLIKTPRCPWCGAKMDEVEHG